MIIIGGAIFVLGLVFGSFLNMLEYRIEKKKTLAGRSFCPNCKKQIAWHDNIPVISYILLLGKCRQCKKPVSLQYPAIELITGLAFLLASHQTGFLVSVFDYFNGTISVSAVIVPKISFLLLATCYFLLILIALYDAKTKYVLSTFAYMAAFLGLSYNILTSNLPIFSKEMAYFVGIIILCAVVPALLFTAISKLSKGKMMGGGDAEVALAVGALLGWPKVLPAYYFAFIVGALCSLGLLATKKAGMKSEVPFGPFLIAGIFFASFYGEQIIAWYGKMFLGY